MATSPPLRLYYDYVDPASFLVARQVLHHLPPGADDRVEWCPLEICPPPTPLLSADDPDWRAGWEQLEAYAAEEGLSVRLPWIVPWSRKAHELALHARERSCFREIHDAIFRAYFVEDRDIGRVDVLVEIAGEEGLDPMETKAVLDVDRFRGGVEERRQRGLEAGVDRPPVLEWRGRRVVGVPGRDDLKALLAPFRETDER